jgi:hypothetical protein
MIRAMSRPDFGGSTSETSVYLYETSLRYIPKAVIFILAAVRNWNLTQELSNCGNYKTGNLVIVYGETRGQDGLDMRLG